MNKQKIKLNQPHISEIFELLEEKRKKAVVYIEQSFENYYSYHKKKYEEIVSKMVKVTHPEYHSEYKFISKEKAKCFFIHYLFTDYTNPFWENEGINILDLMVKIDSSFSFNLDGFHYYLEQKVLQQNAAFRLMGDYAYLQRIAELSNRNYQVLRKMDFVKTDKDLNDSLKDLKNNFEIERQRKIEVINVMSRLEKKVYNLKHFNEKWDKYRGKWLELRKNHSVKASLQIIKSKYPNDKELLKAYPESFNRAMNKYFKNR
jgi:hypothetical protein